MLQTGYPEAWVKSAEKNLKGTAVESLEKKTPEGITLKPLYCAADLERCEAVVDAKQNAPGLFPYHRLVHHGMHQLAPSRRRFFSRSIIRMQISIRTDL